MTRENNVRDHKRCGYCTFEKYNLNREEARKGYLRGKPIHSAGAGRNFEEVYIRKESEIRFCLIVDAADIKIVRPVKFCPCCGRKFQEASDPLNIRELRQLNKCPIYVVPLEERLSNLEGWCVVDGETALQPGNECWWWELSEYSKTWIAYRQEPSKNETAHRENSENGT